MQESYSLRLLRWQLDSALGALDVGPCTTGGSDAYALTLSRGEGGAALQPDSTGRARANA